MVRFYKWNYGWQQIKALYIQKQKEESDKTNQFCEFLVELTSAAFGGGKSDNPDEVGLDTGEGSDEMSEEDQARMIATLGEKDFYNLFPHLKPEQ